MRGADIRSRPGDLMRRLWRAGPGVGKITPAWCCAMGYTPHCAFFGDRDRQKEYVGPPVLALSRAASCSPQLPTACRPLIGGPRSRSRMPSSSRPLFLPRPGAADQEPSIVLLIAMASIPAVGQYWISFYPGSHCSPSCHHPGGRPAARIMTRVFRRTPPACSPVLELEVRACTSHQEVCEVVYGSFRVESRAHLGIVGESGSVKSMTAIYHGPHRGRDASSPPLR